jgi:hypothetical protein
MASIFDSLADTVETAAPPAPAKTGSIFDSLGEAEAPAAPSAASAGEIPRGSPYTAPAATSSESGSIGRLLRGKNVKEAGQYAATTAVDLGDIALGGIPAMLLGTIGEVTQRASGLVDGRGYREGAKAGAEFSRSMGEKFGRPLFDSLVAAGLLNKETRSIPMQAMDKIGGWLEHAATIVEADSGGFISKEDYLASINGFMAAMGVKGAQVMTQKGLTSAATKKQKSAWDTALERFDAEEQLARAKFEEGTPNRTAAKAAAERPADDGLYDGDFAQQAAARREAFLRRKAYEKGVANFPPSGEGTGSRGPVDLTLEGKETPTSQPHNQPFHTADTTAAIKRGIVADTPIETEGALRPAARPPLDTGLEKVKGGRLFDMTMEERLAVKNSVDITDPKIITAAAVGATGLGLAMAYEPSAEEAAMAIGAGALLRRRGKGEPLRETLGRPEATPLGALLEAQAYTTSTLEKLADSSPGKFEFKKSAVEQLLKREGVTKHERDLLTEVLAGVPRDTVTAKELIVGLKMAAKDFELRPAKVENYADYGLRNIDRVDSFGDADNLNLALDANEPVTRVYRSPLELGSNNHFQDPNYFAHTRSFEEGGVRHVVELQSDLAQKAGKPPTPETIAKAKEQLAVNEALDAAWGDVQYGVSRAGNYSFFDGLQRFFKRESELNKVLGHDDQRLMLEEKLWRTASRSTDPVLKELTEEFYQNWEKTAPEQTVKHYGEGWVDISEGFAEWLIKNKNRLTDRSEATLRYALQELANRNTQEALVGISEAMSKLEAGASAPVSPMLKDWHKRLVREELADAARNLELSVRFATADTVAKVEGWPDSREARRTQLAGAQERLASAKEHVANLEAMKRGEAPKDDYYSALKIADPEAFDRVLKHIDAELSYAQETLRESQLQFDRTSSNWGDQPRFYPEHQGIYDRYSRDVEKFLRQLGGKPYTDSAGHTWIEVPLGEQQKALPGGGARTQIGGVDPGLLKGAAVVGGVAGLAYTLSSKKERDRHAIWMGALAGLGLYAKSRSPVIAKLASDFSHGTQYMLGNLSTDKALPAPVLRRLTNFEMDTMVAGHKATHRIAPFIEQLDQIPDSIKPLVNAAIMNGKTNELRAVLGRRATPAIMKAWEETQALLRDLGKQAQEVKLLKDLRPDYFPRMVKDLPGLLNAIGKEHATDLQFALERAKTRAGGKLDKATEAEVINRFLEKNLRSTTGGKPSFLKRRTIEGVTVDLEPFYTEPMQALPLYVGSMVRAIERARFFGKDLIVDAESGRPNLEASIGAVVARESKAGNITPENFTRFSNLLRSRFGPGEQSPHRILQSLGQFTNIALLANVFSAAMNLADIGGISAQQGPLAAAKALQKRLTGRATLTSADVGMAEAIGAEFIYGTRDPLKVRIPLTQHQVQISLAKALDKTFKLAGFKAADTVMKEVHLNAAMEKYQRLSRTPAGEKQIVRQYASYFTTDMGALLSDLRAGKKSRLTTELAFRELSDAQPTTRIEMPQFYIDHPNFRFTFALKSFMIKQLNLIKKRGVDEIRKGDAASVRVGTGFLIRYALMAGAAGASMDWIIKSMLGRDADMEWGDVPLNALKNFGLSQYILDKMQQGKGKEAIASAFIPPLDPILNIATGDPEGVRNFPLVGRLVYDRFMDGAEKANAAKRLAEKKKARDAARTPEERRELERRALERRKALTQ